MPLVTVVVPTLQAGDALGDCLDSLGRQTMRDFEAAVVDNSERGAARAVAAGRPCIRLIENAENAGFGKSLNQAARGGESRYVATLNDDAAADPGWLEALVDKMERHPGAGMGASCVLLKDAPGRLDSAGMLLCGDGCGKQRGHGEPAEKWSAEEVALYPSGSAAIYRRAMLDEIGWFDERFFVYCEDTDVGLRGRWAGWECVYATQARVMHEYSRTAGRASPLKAYYVELNRRFVVLKNFPERMRHQAPLYSLERYWWHAAGWTRRRGAASGLGAGGALKLIRMAPAGVAAYWRLRPEMLREGEAIRREARLSQREFESLVRDHWISPKEVAFA